jgi:hypothetical protein
MRFLLILFIILLLITGCDQSIENTADTGAIIRLEETDLEKTPEELINILKNIEDWTLEVLVAHEIFTPIDEYQKDEMIKLLSEVYTPDAANALFMEHYRKQEDNYQRVPTHYSSINSIKNNLSIEKTINSDETLLEISGETENGESISRIYYIDHSDYRIKLIEINTPY